MLISIWKNKRTGSIGKKRRRIRTGKDMKALADMIAEEEARKKKAYCRIGQLYATLHQKDAEESFAELLDAIAISDGKLRAYKKALKKYGRLR